MSNNDTKSTIKSRVLKTEPIKWSELQFLQHDDFKDLAAADRDKLRSSILTERFSEPFKVWQEKKTGIIYCLDGFHRAMILRQLIEEGYTVPDRLPATFIDCKNKKEAARLVLVYSSIYARVTTTGFETFVQLYDINPTEMDQMIDLPGLRVGDIPALDAGEQGDPFDDDGITGKNQFAVIVVCRDESDQENKFRELTEQGYECKIVVT